MDLDSDGKTDILSGSYSRMGKAMAGLFYVLPGVGERDYAQARVLKGQDGKELIIDGKEEVEYICTRPTAVDLDADGNLDLVVGNFRGTFAFFRGKKNEDGKHVFDSQSSWLTGGAAGTKLKVDAHSDPVFVDWDKDGDLDMLSGSASGNVYYFRNDGSAKSPEWAARQTFIKSAAKAGSFMSGDVECGDAHLAGAQGSTRVCVEDMNGDGKLDLLVGDQATLYEPADGYDAASMRQALTDWGKRYQEVSQAWVKNIKPGDGGDKKLRAELNKKLQALMKERRSIVKEDRTGFVWVYHAK